MNRLLTTCCVALTLLSCGAEPERDDVAVVSPADLQAHGDEFRQRVETVADGVHVAIGYALANSIMIEGTDGVIIVDTTESLESARAIKAEFDKLTQKPVKAIIYTHNHADHIFGGPAFAGDDAPDVYSHALTSEKIEKVIGLLRPIIRKRSYRMFGLHLDETARTNAGIGPGLAQQKGSTVGLLRPTHTFDDRLDVTIAGITLQLMHAPGETEDQLLVWLPKRKILLSGDNFYKAFPNLYTIRGTTFRDPTKWVNSLDTMRYLEPEILIPSHTAPLIGKETIYAALTDYRDAIQYLHDQTVLGMNKGLTPDEVVEEIALPSHLRQSPYLKEFYGNINLCVRAIYSGYLGPFDGNPRNLRNLTARQRAGRIASLAGGEPALRQQAADALAAGDTQWALELTDHLLWLAPKDHAVIDLRTRALTALAEVESNPNLRHYYLSAAHELAGNPNTPFFAPPAEIAHKISLKTIFSVMPTTLDARKAAKVDKIVVFKFPDVNETFSVHIRRGVAEVQPFELPNADNTVTIDSVLFKEIVAQLASPIAAVRAGDMVIDGSAIDLAYFLQLFKPVEK